MLTFEAFKMIPSTKRGCKGELEKLVEQAVRMSTNVKTRQTKTQDASLEILEKKNLLLQNSNAYKKIGYTKEGKQK